VSLLSITFKCFLSVPFKPENEPEPEPEPQPEPKPNDKDKYKD